MRTALIALLFLAVMPVSAAFGQKSVEFINGTNGPVRLFSVDTSPNAQMSEVAGEELGAGVSFTLRTGQGAMFRFKAGAKTIGEYTVTADDSQSYTIKSAQAGHLNPGFEEPRGIEGRFTFVDAMPGWRTTDKEFEIWSTGFQDVEAREGTQFVELNAHIDGTLYQDSEAISADSVLEFTFAHRGRNGKDTMKLTITDLGKDNELGGGDDTVLFTKEYSTGKEAWAVYDSTTEKKIVALGNAVRFAYTAVYGTGGKGPDKTEGNFLDAANFGVGVVSEKRNPSSVAGSADQARELLIGKWIGNPEQTAKHSPGLKREDDISGFTLYFSDDDSQMAVDRQVVFDNKGSVSRSTGVLNPGEGENGYRIRTWNFNFLTRDRIVFEGVVLDRVGAEAEGAEPQVYDFEQLSEGPLAEQDGWKMFRFGPADANGIASQLPVSHTNQIVKAGPPISSSVMDAQTIGWLYRVNDDKFAFQIGDPNRVTIQCDMLETRSDSRGHMKFYLASKDHASSAWIGFAGKDFEYREAHHGVTITVPRTFNDADNGVNDWYRLKLDMDFASDRATVSYMNLTDGDTEFLPIPKLTDIQLSKAGQKPDPLSWDRLVIRTNYDVKEDPQTRQIDNLVVSSISTSGTPQSFAKAGTVATFADMNFVWCPPGTFQMGSPDTEEGRIDTETPHMVTLSQGFWMGQTEVTQEQYQKVMGTNPSTFKGDKRPVETVSWDDAVKFCKTLTETGHKDGWLSKDEVIRLPTEAEWEYARRAGTTTAYSFVGSDAQIEDYAWYVRNSDNTTHPVSEKKPNAWGLYDMHGNVSEWCQDWYGNYLSDPVTDPAGSSSGSDRVMRGGNWHLISDYCRSARRGRHSPGLRDNGFGFRVLRSSVHEPVVRIGNDQQDRSRGEDFTPRGN